MNNVKTYDENNIFVSNRANKKSFKALNIVLMKKPDGD